MHRILSATLKNQNLKTTNLEQRQDILNEYLEKERDNCSINNLKLKYNKIIGYFFEVNH